MLKKHHLSVLYLLPILLLTIGCEKTIQTTVESPNAIVKANFDTSNGLYYNVVYNGDTLLTKSAMQLVLKSGDTLSKFSLESSETTSVATSWERVWGKNKEVKDEYNQLVLHLKDSASGLLVDVYCRAYDDGVGIRYGFPEQETKTIELADEQTQFAFTGDHTVWRGDYETYESSQEKPFEQMKLSEITHKQLVGMPLLVKVKDSAYAVVSEANLTDWSGAFLKSDTLSNTVVTKLTPNPNDTTVAVVRKTPAVSPWRMVMVAKQPGDLITSNLLSNLNDPLALEDASWIQPGASAWDWWWSNKYAPSVDFELGCNQKTMEFYIDYAAEMGWEYQIVDWLWYGTPFINDDNSVYNPDVDITTCIDEIDIPKLVQYAKAKNVKLIVWLHWKHLQNQLDEALPLYEKWGVAGIKVDFMNRQDQEMVNFYHDVTKKAAEHHLVVDFHGAYKPTGYSRTYPNLITREGVMGNEYNKWERFITPEHNVTLPFTRGLLGEMDYTPVAFRNVTPEAFTPEADTADNSPMVMSTRCQQLAMPVVYESAFTVFCDSPDNYKLGVGAEFLKDIPTSWDETKVLNAEVGDYIVVARRKGEKWYVGGMTDATGRNLSIDLDFLPKGTYKAVFFEDGKDANTNPMHANRIEFEVSSGVITFVLANGGGFAGTLEKVN